MWMVGVIKPAASPLNFMVRYKLLEELQFIGPPVELLHEPLVREQAEPSSTWKTPFVMVTDDWVSCHKHDAVEVQDVVVVGLAVLYTRKINE
jgi:hypothetical protein